MYIVPSRKKSGDKTYTYYNLVEGVRTSKGPRHRVILSLCELEHIDQESIKLLSRLIDQRLGGQIRLLPPEADEQLLRQEAERIAQMVVQKNAVDREHAEVVNVKLDRIEASEALLLGSVYLGEQMWKRLGLHLIMSECGFSARQCSLALVEVVARLVNPGSELATSSWIARTALSDLLGEKLDYVNKDSLYRISDQLWAKREPIERALAKSEAKLFDLEQTIVLYDLTSTYFEGPAMGNPKASMGYSRDNRGDCKQLVVGMVLDEAGFPKASETWKGNTHDSRTLEAMLEQLESRCGKSVGATVVMDRGIASADNVARLLEGGYHYIVAVAGNTRHRWVDEIKTGSFERLDGNHPQIEVCRKEREGESYLLVRSAKRVAKDKAIRERFSLRIESELTTLAASVAARKVKAQKARERIGRIRQRNQRASRYFVTELSENDGELKLTWGGYR